MLFVSPRVGQKVVIYVPERQDSRGKEVKAIRPGTPRRPYVSGETARWDDYLVFLNQEGAIFATEIVE
jgi:hypothetical protein